MWRMERHVPRGGGSLKPSHNQGLWQVWMFNNLALWGEKKFVSELKRTYKFQRGVYCHTEDNSPKYRMVGKIYQCLTNVVNRLRNKCAMTGYDHAELVSVACGLNPSPAFQAPSAQGRQGHTHRTALRFPLSPQVTRGKIKIVEDMKGNSLTDMVYSLFTIHYSLFPIHLLITIRTFYVSFLTFHLNLL